MISVNSTPNSLERFNPNHVTHTMIFDRHSSITFVNLELKVLIKHLKENPSKEINISTRIDSVHFSLTTNIFYLESLRKQYTGDFIFNHVTVDDDRVIIFDNE